MNARQRLQAARTDLILDHPFFGTLALRLAVVEDPGCGTAWTDGRSLGYDPAFVDTLSRKELLGVVAHEVMHCAQGHPWRRNSREQRRWNVACDFAINYILAESGFSLPAGCLRAAEFDGKSAEWVYDRLPQMAQQQGGQDGDTGDGQDQGTGTPGSGGQDVRDATGHAGEQDAPTEADWQAAVQQAAQAAKARGNLPSSIARFANDAVQPRVDWRSVLRRFVQQAAKADYVWTRPNVRHLARGLYLPSLHSEAMGPIAVAIDTSGSIDQVTLEQFAAEIRSIAGELRPERVYAIYCDAKVHRVDVFEPDDAIELAMCGGGGTAFAPALDAAERLEDEPVCMVYLTDLMGSHRAAPPAFPVLWATTCPGDVPYGETVSLER